MKYPIELLPPDDFIRIHHLYRVNKAHINAIHRASVQVDSEVLPVGKNFKANLASVKTR